MKSGDSGLFRKPLFVPTIQDRGFLGNRISLRRTNLFSVRDTVVFLWFLVSFISIPLSRSIASRGQHGLGRPHFAFFTDWAFGNVDPGEPEQCFLPGLLGFVVLFRCAGKQPATGGKLFLAASVSQQTVMPDLHKPIRQHMKQEPSDELIGFKGHDFRFVVIGVVPPSKRDGVVFKFHKPVVADRDPVGVSAEIIQNVLGLLERLFAVDDPVLFVQIGDQGIEGPRRRKVTYGAGVGKFVLGTELFQISDELPSKELRHHIDVDEKIISATPPLSAVKGQSSAGNDAVNMRMVYEVLTPGVQNANKPDCRPQMLRIRRKFHQGF